MEKKGRNWTPAVLAGGETATAVLVARQQNFVKIEMCVPSILKRSGQAPNKHAPNHIHTVIHTKALTGNEGGEFEPM